MKKESIINGFKSGKWLNKAAKYLNNPRKLLHLINQTGKFLDKKTFTEVREDLSYMREYLRDILQGKYKDYNTSKLVLIIAGLIYVVSPLDLIPDWLPVGGFLDDIMVIRFVFSTVKEELERYKAWNRNCVV